jgi:hypothetical protein
MVYKYVTYYITQDFKQIEIFGKDNSEAEKLEILGKIRNISWPHNTSVPASTIRDCVCLQVRREIFFVFGVVWTDVAERHFVAVFAGHVLMKTVATVTSQTAGMAPDIVDGRAELVVGCERDWMRRRVAAVSTKELTMAAHVSVQTVCAVGRIAAQTAVVLLSHGVYI